jgi:hypothetical protein
MDVRETSVLVRFTPKNVSSEQYNETMRRHQTRSERLVCRRRRSGLASRTYVRGLSDRALP